MGTIKPFSPKPSRGQIEFIDALGGPKAVSEFIGARLDYAFTPQTCSMWKKRGIPYRYHALLVAYAKTKGVKIPKELRVDPVMRTEEQADWVES